MKEWIAFLLPPATAFAGMRLNRLVLGQGSQERFGLGLRFALGLGMGMLVFSQAVLLTALAGINASGWLARGALLWAVLEIGYRLPKWVAELRAPKLQVAHLWLLLLLPVVYSWWVFGRLSTLEGTLEFDANAFWVFKAKMLFLVQGRGLGEVLHQSNLAYAHLDYPMLVPCLYTLGYGAVGRVDEFVNKIWPFWMVVALCLGILSLGKVWRRPHPLPLVMVLSFCFLPASLQFIRSEGGTIPMVFFVSLTALLLVKAISARDEFCLAAGLLALAGCALTKFEGMVYAALWLCLLLPIGWQCGWLRRGWRKQPLLWRSVLAAGISLLPYGWYRLGQPAPHPESGWWSSGIAAPDLTWHRFPQAWFLNVFGRFFSKDFFAWQSADGDHLQWSGQWAGGGSFVNEQLSVLPWLLLALLVFALWRGRARLALESLSLVMLGVFTILSFTIACLPRMQGHVQRMIDFSTANQVGRYYFPFFAAWFLAVTASWFDHPQAAPSASVPKPISASEQSGVSGPLLLALALALAGGIAACGDDTTGTGNWAFPAAIPPVPAGTYPQYRLDPTHRGLSPPGTSLGSNWVLAWQTESFGIGNYSASKSSPAVDVDRIYVGVDDGQLIALDRRNGTVMWRFQTHRYLVELQTTDSLHLGIHGSPALDDANVYIGDYSGYLYAVDKSSGNLVWESQLGGSIGASPVVLGDFVFIAVEYPAPDGKVFVVRAETGAVVWSTPSLGHYPHSSVSIDAPRGLLFVGANNGLLFCFDYVRRQQQWAYPTGGAIKSTAAVVGDTVYITSWDTKLHGVLVDSGEPRLEFATAAASMSSPSVFQDTAYFGSSDGLLYAVDTRDGHLDWAFQTQGPVLSSPTVIQDSALIAIGSRDRHLYLLDLASGALRQSLELASEITSVPVAVGDSLFVNDDAGTLYAFRSPGAAGD